MTTFTYTNRGPIHSEGVSPVRTHLIVLDREGDSLRFTRHYGGVDVGNGITREFYPGEPTDPVSVAKMIHWCCCGWSAGAHEIWTLINDVKAALLDLEACHND